MVTEAFWGRKEKKINGYKVRELSAAQAEEINDLLEASQRGTISEIDVYAAVVKMAVEGLSTESVEKIKQAPFTRVKLLAETALELSQAHEGN